MDDADLDDCVGGTEWRIRRSGLQKQVERVLPRGRPFVDLIPMILDYLSAASLVLCERCKHNFAAVGRICNGCGAGLLRQQRLFIITNYMAESYRRVGTVWTWPAESDLPDYRSRCQALTGMILRENRFLDSASIIRLYDWLNERRQPICPAAAAESLNELWNGRSKRKTANDNDDDENEWTAVASLLAVGFGSSEYSGSITVAGPSRPISKAIDAVSLRFKRADADRMTPVDLQRFLDAGPRPVFAARYADAVRELRMHR